MTEEGASDSSTDIAPIESEDPGWLDVAVEVIKTKLGHLPGFVRTNALKATRRLGAIPGAWIDGKTAEIKAESEARVALTKATTKSIIKKLDVPDSIAEMAAAKHASKILREAVNTSKVVDVAMSELQAGPQPEVTTTGASEQSTPEISSDWLNAFEQEAANMSSEHMQRLFGKILAGEIKRPSSYSIRTVKLMAQLDNHAAQFFVRLCSLASTLQAHERIVDSRVITIGEQPGANGLEPYGLPWSALNTLIECGLIISDLNSYMTYGAAIVHDRRVSMAITYANRRFVLVPKNPLQGQVQVMNPFRVYGVRLSSAGMELLNIVDMEENPSYTEALSKYFDASGYTLTPFD